MKFGYAWTFGETPAPPEKRTRHYRARRPARGIRIGPPHPNGLVSACWRASEFGSDILNGGWRPAATKLHRVPSVRFGSLVRFQGSCVRLRTALPV